MDSNYYRLRAAMLPENGGRGGWWNDHSVMFNALLWRLRTGAA